MERSIPQFNFIKYSPLVKFYFISRRNFKSSGMSSESADSCLTIFFSVIGGLISGIGSLGNFKFHYKNKNF